MVFHRGRRFPAYLFTFFMLIAGASSLVASPLAYTWNSSGMTLDSSTFEPDGTITLAQGSSVTMTAGETITVNNNVRFAATGDATLHIRSSCCP